MDALVAANYTLDGTEREVLIPYNHTFGMMAVWAENFTDITITVDGTLKLSKRHNKWPLLNNRARHFIEFDEIHNVSFRGNGTIDGQGYMWWVREFLQLNPNGRPKLLRVDKATNITMTGIRWLNAPEYNIHITDVDGLYCHDFEIMTNMKG